MFGIGGSEFILIALVLLIFVGPKHLPEMLRKFGKLMGELRAASRDLRSQVEVELDDIPSPSEIARDLNRELTDAIPSPQREIERAEKALRREIDGVAEAMGEEKPAAPSATTPSPKKED